MTLFFVCWFSLFQPDSYSVVYVTGNVEIVNSSGAAQPVVRGSRLHAGDRLRMLTAGAFVRLAGPGGTWQARPGFDSRTNHESKGVWSGVLKDILLPTPVAGEMRSRGGVINSLVDATQAFTAYADSVHPLLIVEKWDLPVSASLVTDTAAQHFYLSYQVRGDTINKKIPWVVKGGILQARFDRRLFTIDGKDNGADVLPPCRIFYYDANTRLLTEMRTLSVRYVSLPELQPQLCGIRKAMGAIAVAPLLGYIRAYYGLTDEAALVNDYFPTLNCQ